MTTTEHAGLIERINSHLARLDKEAAIPGVGDQLLRHEHSTELLRSAITALRTSRRDGWLEAADRVERRATGIKKALDDFDKETHVSIVDLVDADDAAAEADSLMEVAQDLRRNAPQESD